MILHACKAIFFCVICSNSKSVLASCKSFPLFSGRIYSGERRKVQSFYLSAANSFTSHQPHLTRHDVALLKNLITDHHKMFIQCYPAENVYPKCTICYICLQKLRGLSNSVIDIFTNWYSIGLGHLDGFGV